MMSLLLEVVDALVLMHKDDKNNPIILREDERTA